VPAKQGMAIYLSSPSDAKFNCSLPRLCYNCRLALPTESGLMALLGIEEQKSVAGPAYALNLILLIEDDSLDVITWVQGGTLLNSRTVVTGTLESSI